MWFNIYISSCAIEKCKPFFETWKQPSPSAKPINHSNQFTEPLATQFLGFSSLLKKSLKQKYCFLSGKIYFWWCFWMSSGSSPNDLKLFVMGIIVAKAQEYTFNCKYSRVS